MKARLLLHRVNLLLLTTVWVHCDATQTKQNCLASSKAKKCSGHGTCFSTMKAGEKIGECRCQEKYGGDLCQKKDPDDCRLLKKSQAGCSGHGTCMDQYLVDRQTWGHRCTCDEAWEGPVCEQLKDGVTLSAEDACESSPCRLGGTCIPVPEGYRCLCGMAGPFPRTGDNCDLLDLTSPQGTCSKKLCKAGSAYPNRKCKNMKAVLKRVKKTAKNAAQDHVSLSQTNVFKAADRNGFRIFSKYDVGRAKLCMCQAGERGDGCQKSCPPGTFGEVCALTCNKGCNMKSKICDHRTGRCDSCKAGYTGAYCETEIPPLTNQCDIQGKILTRLCDRGTCVDRGGYTTCSCHPGFHHTFCTHECSDGTFGVDCKETCGRCREKKGNINICDKATGFCSNNKCERYFSGKQCKKESVASVAVRLLMRLTGIRVQTDSDASDLGRPDAGGRIDPGDGANARGGVDIGGEGGGGAFPPNQPTVLLDDELLKDVENDLQSSLEKRVVFTISPGSSIGGFSLQSLSPNMGRRLRQVDTGTSAVDISFEANFPASATEGRNLQQDMQRLLLEQADQIRTPYLPGLVVDPSSISVSQVRIAPVARDDDPESYSATSGWIMLGGLIATVVLIAVITTVFYVLRRRSLMKERRAAARLLSRAMWGQGQLIPPVGDTKIKKGPNSR